MLVRYHRQGFCPDRFGLDGDEVEYVVVRLASSFPKRGSVLSGACRVDAPHLLPLVVKMKSDEDKIKTLSPHLLMAYSGEPGESLLLLTLF